MTERLKEKEKEGERWTGAIANVTEISSNLDSLQKLLIEKTVYVDGETFARASLSSEQARKIKVLEQRVETLERELDAAISAAAYARTEKRHAEASQKTSKLRALEITRELENTTIMSCVLSGSWLSSCRLNVGSKIGFSSHFRCPLELILGARIDKCIIYSEFAQTRLALEVFELHMEELRAKQEEIAERDKEIKLLEAIIQTLGGRKSLPEQG
ncbi:hypothetical protein OROGR_009669 [Orobanche gracilis]